MRKYCLKCNGEGKYLGNGMTLISCHFCNDINDNKEVNNKTDIKQSSKIDKRSKHYKDAINEIMNSNDSLSRKEAEDIFMSIYNKNEG